MYLMKSNKIFLGVATILAIVVYLYIDVSPHENMLRDKSAKNNLALTDASDSNGGAKGIGVSTIVKMNEQSQSLPDQYRLTAIEEAEAKSWLLVNGGLSKSNSEYAQYSAEVLKKLALEGDPQAIDALGAYYLKEFGIKAATDFYFETAVRGATQVFANLAKIESYYKYRDAPSSEEKNEAAIEVLALYNVAKLRGNKWPNITGADSFISMNKIQISDTDTQKIELRSQEIYNQLQQKRTELGLGPFDNSIPDSVKKYFDQIEYLNAITKN